MASSRIKQLSSGIRWHTTLSVIVPRDRHILCPTSPTRAQDTWEKPPHSPNNPTSETTLALAPPTFGSVSDWVPGWRDLHLCPSTCRHKPWCTPHNCILWEKETLEHSVINRLLSTNPFSQGPGVYEEEKGRQIVRTSSCGLLQRNGIFQTHRTDVYMKSQRLRQRTKEVQSNLGSKTERVKVIWSLMPTKKLFVIDSLCKCENQFLQ